MQGGTGLPGEELAMPCVVLLAVCQLHDREGARSQLAPHTVARNGTDAARRHTLPAQLVATALPDPGASTHTPQPDDSSRITLRRVAVRLHTCSRSGHLRRLVAGFPFSLHSVHFSCLAGGCLATRTAPPAAPPAPTSRRASGYIPQLRRARRLTRHGRGSHMTKGNPEPLLREQLGTASHSIGSRAEPSLRS